MSKLRQGDLFLFQTNDGGEISVKNGEPVMDGGFQSAMYISLFGHDDSPLWMNEYFKENEKLKSEFFSFIKGASKSGANILQAEELAKKDLNWFITEGIADEININITSSDAKRIVMSVQILINGEAVAGNDFEISWTFEKEDPANLRV